MTDVNYKEPTYEYIKGQGWVPQKTSREFTFKGETWIIEYADEAPDGTLSWQIGKEIDLITCSDKEFYDYAKCYWRDGVGTKYPGLRVRVGRNVMYIFTKKAP